MVSMSISFIQQYLPDRLKPFAVRWYLRHKKIFDKRCISEICSFYSKNTTVNPDILSILEYLPHCGLVQYPYPWADKSHFDSVQVFHDSKLGLPYVLLDGKKLYYPSNMKDNDIKLYHYGVQNVEQHLLSPHRYLTMDFDVCSSDIVLDCGAAEGNFGLSVVDHVKKLYLFEPDPKWIDPLSATFSPWRDKVEIVPMYLSCSLENNGFVTSIDSYFQGKEIPTFIKLDVEGYEEKVLSGATRLLNDGAIKKICVCVYHYMSDEQKLGDYLRSYNFTCIPSDGYMIVREFEKLSPPYFRRGLLRCSLNEGF